MNKILPVDLDYCSDRQWISMKWGNNTVIEIYEEGVYNIFLQSDKGNTYSWTGYLEANLFIDKSYVEPFMDFLQGNLISIGISGPKDGLTPPKYKTSPLWRTINGN